MKFGLLKKVLLTFTGLLAIGIMNSAVAHTAGGPIGADASATDLAVVQCFDDGNGPPDHLAIQVEDMSAPVTGLLVSMQAFKDNKMTNITDTRSGDGSPSDVALLRAGGGAYFISVNKSGFGARTFNVTWHCETSSNIHTGAEVDILQIQ